MEDKYPYSDERNSWARQDDPVIGCTGAVCVPTRGRDGPGEVLINIRGGREAYLAWSTAPLATGTQVLVIGIRSGRTVDVVPWAENLSVTALSN